MSGEAAHYRARSVRARPSQDGRLVRGGDQPEVRSWLASLSDRDVMPPTIWGGVADVRQAKKDHVMIDLGYLGELRDVALYVNDRQINRVGYSEEAAERTSYVVRVTSAAS